MSKMTPAASPDAYVAATDRENAFRMDAYALTRVILGLVLAPQAGTLVLILWACVSDSSPVLACVVGSGEMLLFFAWLVALFGYPSVLVLGVPLFLVLRRYRLLRAAPLALAGIAIGFVAAGLFFLVEEKYSVIGMFDWLPFSLRAGVPLAGAVAGLAFWALAVVRNRALSKPTRELGVYDAQWTP